MKLWYQSMTRPQAWPGYNRALREVLETSADPGTQFEVHGITQRGGIGDQYRYLELIETQEVLANVERATREGFDAFLIGNICDPGLREAREATDMPVLGLGETSFHVASLMGANFALVTGSPKHVPKIVENVRKYALQERMHSARSMQMVRLVDLDDGFTKPDVGKALIDRFLDGVAAASAEGAEIAIPAVGVLMVLLARAGVNDSGPAGIPVLNGVRALVKMSEMAVRLRALMGGNWTSRRAMYQQPPPGQPAQLREYYGAVYSGLKPADA
jgi:allantoin racemase